MFTGWNFLTNSNSIHSVMPVLPSNPIDAAYEAVSTAETAPGNPTVVTVMAPGTPAATDEATLVYDPTPHAGIDLTGAPVIPPDDIPSDAFVSRLINSIDSLPQDHPNRARFIDLAGDEGGLISVWRAYRASGFYNQLIPLRRSNINKFVNDFSGDITAVPPGFVSRGRTNWL